MNIHEFLERFSRLSDRNKEMLMAEVFGMLKALEHKETLIEALKEYESKQ